MKAGLVYHTMQTNPVKSDSLAETGNTKEMYNFTLNILDLNSPAI